MSFLFPNKLFYHVFREWMISFIMVSLLMMGMVVLFDLYDNFPDFKEFDASFLDILIFYRFLIPSLSTEILNLSLLIATLFSLGSLHKNNEITAMKASGLNTIKITQPVWIGAIVLCVFSFFLHSYMVPLSTEKASRFFSDLKFRSEEKNRNINEVGLHYNLGFHNHENHRLWLINRLSERSYVAFGVGVYQRDKDGQEKCRILAKEAFYDDRKNHWTFLEGREVLFNVETGVPYRSVTFKEKTMKELNENPSLMVSMAKDLEDLSLFQIKQILDTMPPDENPHVTPHLVKYQKILAAPLTPLIIIVIAIPFAIGGVRTNPVIGISKALGLFVFYILISKVFTLFGETKLLSPFFAAWTPNFLVLSVASFFGFRE